MYRFRCCLLARKEVLTEEGASVEEQHEVVLNAIQQLLMSDPPQRDSGEGNNHMAAYVYQIMEGVTGITFDDISRRNANLHNGAIQPEMRRTTHIGPAITQQIETPSTG